ncbi:UNVERIFIED_CONTAM: hypothetical protein Slati_2714200 [Sesamum latifolium]|uniref:Reverse transcriptase domain-containing protein n=1 Tax=Sesamum latifolium TaxID=2727402 RepID=A0AAW2VXS9_9LAMI
METMRKKQNTIVRLKDDHGLWGEDSEGIQEVLLGYFRDIFSSSNPFDPVVEAGLNTVNPRVTAEMNESLIQPFTAQEVRSATFSMAPLKSPGPDAQSTFIPNRLITDNVLVAFELNHFIKNWTRGKDGYFALKLDMSKAYDRVEWNFLRKVLLRIGIHESFVKIIMNLVTSVSYSLMLNEVFSAMLVEAEQRGEIKGFGVSRSAPHISHLLFADDTIIFGQVRDGLESIKRVLEVYGRASGQQINLEKSSMVISRNVGEQERLQLAAILGVQLVTKHDKYWITNHCGKITGGIVSID